MTTITRSRLARGVALAGAGALAITLVPAVTTASAAGTPQFAYLSDASGSRALSSNGQTGTTGGAATSVTPSSGYQVYGYDAANDGKTWVGCMASGAATADSYDRTYALVLTHTNGAQTQTRVLSTFCEANPVISADGGTVWWLADDRIYRYAATYDAGTAAISGTPSVVSAGQFVSATNVSGDVVEDALALAVSPDGVNAAVLYNTGTAYRLRVQGMAAGASKPDYFQKTWFSTSSSATAYIPVPNIFTFVSNATLAFDLVDQKSAVSPKPMLGAKVNAPVGGTGVVIATGTSLAPTLNDVYDLRSYDDGVSTTWYAWKDTYAAGAYVNTQAGTTTDPLTTAPASFTARGDGATTFRYIPTAANLPALQQAVNRSEAHPTFALSATTALYRKQAAYQSWNLYDTDPLGGAYDANAAAEVDKGTLEWSTNGGASWASLGTTSGANVFALGTKWYNGKTPILARNTAFRWTFAGDLLTAPSAPVVRTIKVVPIVTVKKSVSGSYTTVYGYATRKLGTAVLQRYTTLGWRTVGTGVAMTSTGVYNFGRKVLVKGKYRVVTAADTNWAAGATIFTV